MIQNYVFDDSLVDTEEKNDSQQNEREGLDNIEKIGIHDDVEDGSSGTRGNLDDLVEDNNMDGIENDDSNTFGNNIDGLQESFNDDKDEESEDEDDENTTLVGWCRKKNIKYLKEYMNIDNDTLDDIVADNNVNEKDL